MDRMRGSTKSRLRPLAAVAALVASVGVVPMFGSTAYAAGLDLNGVVSVSQFIIPGVPISKTAGPVPDSASLPAALDLADNVAGLFPASGELLLDKTELVVYDLTSCGAIAADQVCITQRAKVGQQKTHAVGTGVKLATQLTAPISGTGVAHTTLATTVSETQSMPFAISVGDDTGFGTSGHLTIWHQDTTVGAGAPAAGDPTTEYFQYDRSCGTASQLCLTARALNPNNEAYNHPADPYSQPGGTPGRSLVDKHAQIQVKSNASFFPTGTLIVYEVGPNNEVHQNAELIGYNNAATKIKNVTIPGTEFHVTSRGDSPATFKKTPILPHPAGSIVTGPDQFIVSRIKNESPIPGLAPSAQCDVTCVANSVGTLAVAYTQSQPNGSPKTLNPKQLQVPVVGSTQIVLNALNQPFLSTGGFQHLLFGDVPLVDDDGTKDGVLNLISPCITNVTPGTNLQVTTTLQVDQDYQTTDSGDARVVMDTITGPGGGNDGDPTTHDDCDDPAGTSDATLTTYIYPGDSDTSDDDTDGDGCNDARELDNNVGTGGQRDPWNKADFFDTDNNQAVAVADIFAVAAKFGSTAAGGAPYSAIHDRGLTYGPFGHNLSKADGSIAVTDIFAVAAQFGHSCL